MEISPVIRATCENLTVVTYAEVRAPAKSPPVARLTGNLSVLSKNFRNYTHYYLKIKILNYGIKIGMELKSAFVASDTASDCIVE